MSLSDRLQATFRQYEAMDHSAPILRSSIEQSYKNAGEIEQAIRVLKSGLTMAWLPIFVIAFFGAFLPWCPFGWDSPSPTGS